MTGPLVEFSHQRGSDLPPNSVSIVGDWLFENELSYFGLRFLANNEGIMLAIEKGGSSIGRHFAYVIHPGVVALIAFWDHGGATETLKTPATFQHQQSTDSLEGAFGFVLSRRDWPWPDEAM